MIILQVYKTTNCYRIILHTLATIEKIYPACPVDILQSTGVKSRREIFNRALGKTAKKEFLPGMIYLTGLPMQPGDVPKTEADVTDLMADLNYKPDTPVNVGIERFIEWYKEYFEIQITFDL